MKQTIRLTNIETYKETIIGRYGEKENLKATASEAIVQECTKNNAFGTYVVEISYNGVVEEEKMLNVLPAAKVNSKLARAKAKRAS